MTMLKKFSICFGGIEKYSFTTASDFTLSKSKQVDEDLILGMLEAIQNISEEFGDPIVFMVHKSGVTTYMFTEMDLTLRFYFTKPIDQDILEYYKRQIVIDMYPIIDDLKLKVAMANSQSDRFNSLYDEHLRPAIVQLITALRQDMYAPIEEKKVGQLTRHWNRMLESPLDER